jgi:short-subunit dehydrogenase
MAIYYATKAYILSFSEAIANELKGTGVTVTVLCPGQTKTSFQEVVSQETSENKIGFNIACPKQVATYGYKAMLKGKTVVVPGKFNKFLSKLPRIMPRKTATSIVRKIQEKNRD